MLKRLEKYLPLDKCWINLAYYFIIGYLLRVYVLLFILFFYSPYYKRILENLNLSSLSFKIYIFDLFISLCHILEELLNFIFYFQSSQFPMINLFLYFNNYTFFFPLKLLAGSFFLTKYSWFIVSIII